LFGILVQISAKQSWEFEI